MPLEPMIVMSSRSENEDSGCGADGPQSNGPQSNGPQSDRPTDANSPQVLRVTSFNGLHFDKELSPHVCIMLIRLYSYID